MNHLVHRLLVWPRRHHPARVRLQEALPTFHPLHAHPRHSIQTHIPNLHHRHPLHAVHSSLPLHQHRRAPVYNLSQDVTHHQCVMRWYLYHVSRQRPLSLCRALRQTRLTSYMRPLPLHHFSGLPQKPRLMNITTSQTTSVLSPLHRHGGVTGYTLLVHGQSTQSENARSHPSRWTDTFIRALYASFLDLCLPFTYMSIARHRSHRQRPQFCCKHWARGTVRWY
jgi:hypothetical protein